MSEMSRSSKGLQQLPGANIWRLEVQGQEPMEGMEACQRWPFELKIHIKEAWNAIPIWLEYFVGRGSTKCHWGYKCPSQRQTPDFNLPRCQKGHPFKSSWDISLILCIATPLAEVASCCAFFWHFLFAAALPFMAFEYI